MTFARHQTFQPRNGWLEKGFRAIQKEPDFFFREDSHIELGVGKNMAEAIRYWLEAFELTNPLMDKGRTIYEPSLFGLSLLDPQKGKDPYLESVESLWILHYKLITSFERATLWWHTFFRFGRYDFRLEELIKSMMVWLQKEHPEKKVADSSVKKDALMIARMYLPPELQAGKSKGYEDQLDTVFGRLNLVGRGGENDEIFFKWQNEFSSDVLLYCAMEYVIKNGIQTKTLDISNLVNGDGSLGRAFLLREYLILKLFEEISANYKSVHLAETAGISQIIMEKSPKDIQKEALERIYQ